jgi:iron complex transport system ATP-binding protein
MSFALQMPEPDMVPLLSASHLGFAYGSRRVLGDVSLIVHPGEVVALLGPNGAGKSTLLKLLAGLLTPAEGSLSVPTPRPRSVAYLAQSEELPLDWCVRATVELGRLPYVGLFRRLTHVDHAAVQRALVRTSTLEDASRLLSTLSGGERQRVALARALAQEPRLLLLDEPTAHLDVRHQVELLALLRLVASEGVAVIAVMHDLTLAGHADRCIVLADGAVQADGAPADVLSPRLLQRVYQTELEVLHTSSRRAVVVPGAGSTPSTSSDPR